MLTIDICRVVVGIIKQCFCRLWVLYKVKKHFNVNFQRLLIAYLSVQEYKSTVHRDCNYFCEWCREKIQNDLNWHVPCLSESAKAMCS